MKNAILIVISLMLIIACDDAQTPPVVVEYDGRQSLEMFSVDTIISVTTGGDWFEPDEGRPVLYEPDGNGPDLLIRNEGEGRGPRIPDGFRLIPSNCHSPREEGCDFAFYHLIPASGRHFGTEQREETLPSFVFYPEDRDSVLFHVDSSAIGSYTIRLPLCCDVDPIECNTCIHEDTAIYHFQGASSGLYYSVNRIRMELVSDSAAVTYFTQQGYLETGLTENVNVRVRIEGFRQNNPNSTWVIP